MRNATAILGVLVLGTSAYLAANMIPASGILADLDPLLVDRCERIEVAPGTEDVTVDVDAALAFVSASDRRAIAARERDPGAPTPARGGIFAVDLRPATAQGSAAPRFAARLVSPAEPADFQPHGISLWKGSDGGKRLFVLNHPLAGGHQVEIFEVGDRGSLRHVETIGFEAMYSPNDLVAVGPRSFYATNDRGYREGPLATLEAYLALPLASAVYFDGETGRVVRPGLVFANGIQVSADGSTVYISELLKRRIAVHARDAVTGDLTPTGTIAVGTSPDNIELASDGSLWIAGHSRVFDFLAHVEDPKAVAPSHVQRVDPASGAVEDVFLDTAGRLNASSVGATWEGTDGKPGGADDVLLVGAVFDAHVLACPLPPESERPNP